MPRHKPHPAYHSLLFVVLSSLLPSAGAETAPASPSPEAVLASAEGETPGQRVELHGLKRNNGDTLTLTFALVNDSDKPIKFGYDFVEKGKNVQDFASIGGAHLIDALGKKKYLVLRDADDIPLASRGIADVAAQSRVNLWAKFPAPPMETQTISVVIPHFVPFDDVAISP